MDPTRTCVLDLAAVQRRILAHELAADAREAAERADQAFAEWCEAPAYLRLGDWATTRRLQDEAREANERARKAAGYLWRWLTAWQEA